MVFLKTRPYVKQKNTEFTNVSSFTLLLLCSTHFIMSFRIHFFSTPPPPPPPPTLSFVYSEITRKSAWQVLLRTPSLAIEGHPNLTHFDSGPLISRTFLPHAGSSCTSLCLYLVPCTQKNVEHSLADTVAPILTNPVYLELRYWSALSMPFMNLLYWTTA